MGLSKDRIAAEAQALVDDVGLDGLNMRALAERLNVRASALYYHFTGRDELVAAMAGEFYRHAFLAVPDGLTGEDWLISFAHALRAELLAHRDSARLCAMSKPMTQDEAARYSLTAPLLSAGFDQSRALTCVAMSIALTQGWVSFEQSETLHDYLAEAVGFDGTFERGIEALVAGLARGGGPGGA